jgi:hypothetical protein
MGISYEDMTDVQKKHYAEQFKLGDDYEAKLKQIMESEQHATGASERDQGAVAADVLKRMQESGRTYETLGRDFKDMMMEKNNLTEDDLREIFEKGGDVGDIVSRGLREKQSAEDARAAARSTEATEDSSTQEAANRVSRQAAASSNAIKASNQKILEILQKQPDAFEKLITSIDEKNFAPEVLVSLDGKSFTQYVIDNPRGTKDRIVIVPLG